MDYCYGKNCLNFGNLAGRLILASQQSFEICFTGYQYLKVTVNAFDCVRHTGPAYIRQVCLPVVDVTGRSVGPHNERPTPDKYNDYNVKNTIDIE